MTSRSWTRFASLFGLALALGACTLGAGDGGDGEDGAAEDGGDDGGKGDDGGSDDAARAPFFLPTGEPDNTAAPTIEVDGTGRIHAVYPAYAGGDAYYATCAGDCAGPDAVEVVRLPTNGSTVANAMLALDGEGRPRVLLSTFGEVIYSTCDADCGDGAAWTQTQIVKHDGHREVSGEALALDPGGNPRFIMHTYVAYLGIGQEAPETSLVSCDGACHDAASWTQSRIADQIWQSSTLRYDATGKAHLATVAHVVGDDGLTTLVGAYLRCDGGCDGEDAWNGTGLENAYVTEYDAISIKPTISMALTSDARPRIAILGKDEQTYRRLVYFACDAADCAADGAFTGSILTDSQELGTGLDLALDGDDAPRIAYTFDYNIGLAHCDGADCTAPDAPWDLAKVELGSEMKPDDIFLEWNCNVAAWFLHSPSVAIGPSGAPRVGYQARDISGGVSNPDPTKPDCVAGTDMTWSRLALMSDL